jgi:hypothetical protein
VFAKFTNRRALSVLAGPAAAVLAGGALVLATPGVASATAVTTEAEFTTAWEANGTSSIELSNDITLTCDSGAPFRNSATGIVIEGNGFTLRQTCPDSQVMSSHGTGAVTFRNLTVTGGDASGATPGGAILAFGDLTVEHSTITDNHAEFSGGALTGNGTITVIDSTVSNNTTGGNGGGIAGNNLDSAVVVINSTITGNAVTSEGIGGGGIAAADLTLIYSTVVDNSATVGANVFIHQTTNVFRNSFGSVVARPAGGGENCGFQGGKDVTSSGFNFSDDASCLFAADTDRQDAGDPMLGALGANGGPTLTMLPQAGSPLVDAIPVEQCQADGAAGIATDQRGVTRPQGGGCDVGAVEVAGTVVPPVTPPVTPPAPIVEAPRFTG